MQGRVLLLLLVPALTGCVVPGQGIPGASHWDWSLEDSMLPDFEGDGPSYPVLVLHQHAAPSKAMEREWRENPVVCLSLDGAPIPETVPAADMAPCEGPVADPGAGRLFVNRGEFDSWDADAVVVRQDDCYGTAFPLDGDEPGFQIQTPEHTFRVERADGGFLVDGKLLLPPGKTLKVTYWVDHGDPDNQRFVRVVLDYPGQWLDAHVGLRGYEPPVRPGQATYTDEGRVLAAWLPRFPVTLDDILAPLVDATEGSDATVAGLRFALADGALSELDVAVRTEVGLTRWFLASRDSDQVRVLGNRSGSAPAGMDPSALLDAFGDDLQVYGGDGVAKRFVWRPDVAYDDPAAAVAVGPAGCDDCVLLWDELVAWYWAPLARETEGAGARTLAVTAYAAEGDETVRTYHRS